LIFFFIFVLSFFFIALRAPPKAMKKKGKIYMRRETRNDANRFILIIKILPNQKERKKTNLQPTPTRQQTRVF